jgi:hypothetical protein
MALQGDIVQRMQQFEKSKGKGKGRSSNSDGKCMIM